MATVAQIAKASLQRILVQGSEAELQPDEYQDYLFALNNYMLALDAEGIALGFTEVADLGDQVTVPVGALRGIIANMAIEVSPDYNGQITPGLQVAAMQGMAAMRKLGQYITPTRLSNTLPIGSGNEGDWSRRTQHFYGGECEADILAETTGAISLETGTSCAGDATTPVVATAPIIRLIKVIVGGTAVQSDFPVFIDGVAAAWDTPTIVSEGAHTITETGQADYAASDWNGDIDSDTGIITIVAGEYKVATITNTSTLLPSKPIVLGAATVSGSEIDLTWTDTSDNETGFRVETSADGLSGWSTVTTTAANTTSYSVTGLTQGTLYYYRVFAFNASGDSAQSNVDSATTDALEAPTSLVATVCSPNDIVLVWVDNSSFETGFRVETSATGTGGWSTVTTTAANILTYHVTSLTPETQYYYRVFAESGAGDSLPSNTDDATTTKIWGTYATLVAAEASGDAWLIGDVIQITSLPDSKYFPVLDILEHNGLFPRYPENDTSQTLSVTVLRQEGIATDPNGWTDWVDAGGGTLELSIESGIGSVNYSAIGQNGGADFNTYYDYADSVVATSARERVALIATQLYVDRRTNLIDMLIWGYLTKAELRRTGATWSVVTQSSGTLTTGIAADTPTNILTVLSPSKQLLYVDTSMEYETSDPKVVSADARRYGLSISDDRAFVRDFIYLSYEIC